MRRPQGQMVLQHREYRDRNRNAAKPKKPPRGQEPGKQPLVWTHAGEGRCTADGFAVARVYDPKIGVCFRLYCHNQKDDDSRSLTLDYATQRGAQEAAEKM